MDQSNRTIDYWHKPERPDPTHCYLWPIIKQVVHDERFETRRAFDLGCGNGSTAEMIRQLGFGVVGIDASETGIARARAAFPKVKFHVANAYDDLASAYGTFPLVVSFEVIEHLYDPRSLVRTIFRMLDEQGIGLISTPYHGYWKNLALALTGRWESHLNPLRLHGHIKFFSEPQLRQLLSEEGFQDITIRRVGRAFPVLAKSMVAIIRKQPRTRMES